VLTTAFDFYGSYLKMNKEDKERVLESELVRDYNKRLELCQQELAKAVEEKDNV
jgi:hypothetical protein